MSQSIEVLIRARPPITSISTEDGNNIQIDEHKSKVAVYRKKHKKQAEFQFSKVFEASASQQEVYEALDVVKYVTEGISGCVLAYGQTNTGKRPLFPPVRPLCSLMVIAHEQCRKNIYNVWE